MLSTMLSTMLFSENSIQTLLNFIEKRIEECDEEELRIGVYKIIILLTQAPQQIIACINCSGWQNSDHF